MGGWPLPGPIQAWERGPAPSSSAGVSVAADASANTKGAWVELITAAARSASELRLVVRGLASVADFLVDVGVGPAGSEQVIVPNLLLCGATVAAVAVINAPVHIPAGARVAVRCQSSTGGVAVNALLAYLGGPTLAGGPGIGVVDAIGAATADSGGTGIDGGGTANTKGAWAQLTASTTRPYRGLLVAAGNQANPTRATTNFVVDVGLGAAASEQVILPDLYVVTTSNELIMPAVTGPWWVDIPTGTRVAARCSASSNTAGDREIDIVVYGLV